MKTKVYKVTLMVVDHGDIGEKELRSVIESTRYPNRCITPSVFDVQTKEVDWDDDHPLNDARTSRDEFRRMFGIPHEKGSRQARIEELRRELSAMGDRRDWDGCDRIEEKLRRLEEGELEEGEDD